MVKPPCHDYHFIIIITLRGWEFIIENRPQKELANCHKAVKNFTPLLDIRNHN